MPTISAPRHGDAQSLPALLQTLALRPTPALVFYGHDGGRVELSGRVMENWVAKTANLLVDDLGLIPGDRILLDPSVHWRTAVVAVGAWRVGATVVLADSPTDEGTDTALAVTMAPEALASPGARAEPGFGTGSSDLMVLAHPALAMQLETGQLPDGAIDFCAEIRAHADHYPDAGGSLSAQDCAVMADGTELTHADLMAQAHRYAAELRTQAPRVTAVHLDTTAWSTVSLTRLLGAWICETTVVITDRSEEDVEHLMVSEHVGLTWN